MNLAANLSWLYGEYEFAQRIQEAARDGFGHIECMFPYDHSATELALSAAKAGVQWVLINAPAGDWSKGDRGLAAAVGRQDEFKRSIEKTLEYAHVMNVTRVHVLAGTSGQTTVRKIENVQGSSENSRQCFTDEDRMKTTEWHEMRDVYLKNLDWLCAQTSNEAIDWLIEPINTKDIPGYWLNSYYLADEVMRALGFPARLKLQLDLYHAQSIQGNICRLIRYWQQVGRLGHVQIAGVPDRNEPDLGELDLMRIFDELQDQGYCGYVGCEYRPRKTTREGLGWIQRAGFSGRIMVDPDLST